MGKAIKFVEESDLKQNELCLNLGKFYVKIGQANDEYYSGLKKMHFDYQLQQATLADNHDEKKERLEGDFVVLKETLKRTLHHPKLNETLELAFSKIDEMEEEFREFHERNKTLAKNHPA